METQDYPRFINAIDEAIQGLELEARCYGYREETEHTELITILQNYKAKIQEKYMEKNARATKEGTYKKE